MCIPKWNALIHKIISKFGGIGISTTCSGARTLAVNNQSIEDGGKHSQAEREMLHRIEKRLLVFLEIFVVCKRQSLENGQDVYKVCNLSPSFSSNKFECVWVFLLWHQTGTACDGFGEFDQSCFTSAIKNNVFSEAREMDRSKRSGCECLDDEISIADGIERVCSRRRKSKVMRQVIAVDGICSSSKSARSQWTESGANRCVIESISVTEQHFDICHAPMTEKNWLSTLQMRVTREESFAFAFCQREKASNRSFDFILSICNLLESPESQISCNLVITTATCVQFFPQ